MSFAILGGISAAVAEAAVAGMAATGLGTAAGAGATAGLLGAGTTAAIGSGIGAIGTGALVGSGLGAATSAITGGDPGEGAMFGALGGAATGGLGSALGAGTGSAAGSAASSAGSSFGGLGEGAIQPSLGQAFSASNVMGPGSLVASGAPAAPTVTGNMAGQFAQSIGSGIGSTGTQAASGILGAVPSGITDFVKSSLPSFVTDTATSVLSPTGADQYGMSQKQYEEEQKASAEDARALSRQMYGRPLGGGKLGDRFAEGGDVNLRDGDFILPADIVSAMGDGSTKAGAKFLDEFFGLS